MMPGPHFQGRGLLEQVEINGKPLKIPAMVPRLVDTPGRTDWAGSTLGSHTETGLPEVLGIEPHTLPQPKTSGGGYRHQPPKLSHRVAARTVKAATLKSPPSHTT